MHVRIALFVCIYLYIICTLYTMMCLCFNPTPPLILWFMPCEFITSRCRVGWEGHQQSCWVKISCGDKDPHLPKVRWLFTAQSAWGACHLLAACAQSGAFVVFHLDFWLQQSHFWCGFCPSDLCPISWLTWSVSFYVVDTVAILWGTSGFSLQCLRQWLHFWILTVRFGFCDLALSFTWTDLKLH